MKRIIQTLLTFSILFVNAQNDTINKELNERFRIKNVSINNEFYNFGTTFYGENQVVYTSQSDEKSRFDLYKGNLQANGDIINPVKIKSVSSKSFESNAAFTKDGKSVFFTRSVFGKTNTVKTKKNRKATIAILHANINAKGEWVNIKELPFNSKTYDVGHPALNKDGSKLYFTSNMGGTLGRTDIFVVDVLENGNYSKPENLGEKVNSKYKEAFPYIIDDILYFSSYRKDDAYGKSDIYAVKLYEDGSISDRIHLAPPINSIADDFSYIFDAKKKQGFFSSNRIRGKGADDIYAFSETRPLIFDCYQDIEGQVIDLISGNPVPYAKVILFDAFEKELENFETGDDGKFLFKKVVCSANYKISAEKVHYALKSKSFVTLNRHNGITHVTIPLADDFIVMKRGKRMLNIFNIHFDYDSSAIRKDASDQLNEVVATMRRYPRMVISLGAHTDARGRDAYNLKLSDERAKSTVNYIINKGGISSDRITGKGYGETQLLNDCDNQKAKKCTNLQNELNRRSEFVIVRM